MVANSNDQKCGVLISGGSGLVGQNLTRHLIDQGHRVHHLSRRKKKADSYKVFEWNLSERHIEEGAFEGIDTVIHLAGAGVVEKRWTSARKKELIDSRVQSATLIREYLSKQTHQVKSFISASAIGWYGNTHDKVVKEDAPAGDDFLAEICRQWEAAALSFDTIGIREARVRIGLVMDKKGGVLKNMLLPIKFGLGAMLGSGKQYVSWIDNDDLARMFIYLIENEHCSGAFNGTAPESMTHKMFVKAIASALNRPCVLIPSPEFAIRLGAGEMASALLQSVQAYPQRFLDAGFAFSHPKLIDSLRKILA